MTGSSPIELVKPKPKRRRKAVFSSRKQIAASRMRQQKQRYDSSNNTVKALEFTQDRTRSRSRKRTTQTYGAEDIATKGARVGTTRQVEFPNSHDLSRICETQVWTSSRCLGMRCPRKLWGAMWDSTDPGKQHRQSRVIGDFGLLCKGEVWIAFWLSKLMKGAGSRCEVWIFLLFG